jgi:uncharacterized protein YdhG (YjbR/CyaY superfamily)
MSVIDDYLSQLGAAEKDALERICQITRAAVPDAEETTSYGMPAFKYRGRPLLGFTVSQRHMSLHPFSPGVIEGVKEHLGRSTSPKVRSVSRRITRSRMGC